MWFKVGACELPIKKYIENKSCGAFLGVHVAENVLSKVFKDVEMMPMNNPGYDFICNKGKKIDVKSSCTNKDWIKWTFLIKNNKIADFFLCIAFDNRESLTPQHLWLIPSYIINTKKCISISGMTLHKWIKYELDIKKTIDCCNHIRKA